MLCLLLCARDARFFDLLLLWARTRLPALFGNLRVWRASSYSPLRLDLPDARGTAPANDVIDGVRRIESTSESARMLNTRRRQRSAREFTAAVRMSRTRRMSRRGS